jgi:hypothetical protein
MTDRQLDLPATYPDWYILSRHLPMRLSGLDFVFFIWPKDFDFSRYTVVITSLDTAGPPYRGIGKLKKSVEVPHVQLGWDDRIGVLPDSESLPAFEATMIRGSTYQIPDVTANGRYQMERYGMYRPNGL